MKILNTTPIQMKFQYVFLIAMLVALFSNSCGVTDNNDDYDPVNIFGLVMDSSDQPVENAIVRLVEPPPEMNTVTDADGMYEFELELDTTLDVRVIISKEGFVEDTLTTLAIPEREIEFPDTRLLTEEEAEDEVEIDPDRESSGGPASIELQDVSHESIVVKGAGGPEQARFTFAATDSAGQRITPNHETEVRFRLGSSPGGGESLSPESEFLDNSGEVTTTLTSGNSAGSVQVVAEIERDEFTVKSEPISVAIHDGLPEVGRFTINATPRNISYAGESTSEITVQLGDEFGNPVREGTTVYFSTDGGVIEGSDQTDGQGNASTTLSAVHPIPDDGIATVTASTATKDNESLEEQITVMFSGEPVIDIDPESDTSFNYSVSDGRGNPLEEGTQISVSADNGNVELTGNVDVTIDDTMQSGDGTTDFSFEVTPAGDEPVVGRVPLSIEVDGPNGTATEYFETDPSFNSSGPPASIELMNASHESIVVQGSGNTEQAHFDFAVTDSEGRRVTPDHEAEINFSLGSAPGGGENISPESTLLDDQGEATAVLTSGTVSGNVQIVAEVQHDEGTVRSEPIRIAIHGGLPNEDHFTLQREPYNVTYVKPDQNPSDISVILGDQYSNPVQPGTSVYFSSTGGVIDGSAQTDDQGRAGVQLTPSSPVPSDGIATVTAQTATHNNENLEKEIDVIFSGPPQIEVSPESFFIENMSDQTFEYSVTDENGHPMVNGTQISVEVEAEDIEVIGDVDVTIDSEDVESRQGLTDFSFNVAGTNEEPLDRPVFITIEVEGPNGNTTKRIEGRKERVAP